MEAMVKKYQQKFRKAKDQLSLWDKHQTKLLSLYTNASSIIQRLQDIQNPKNLGSLKSISGIGDALLVKQMDSLQNILISINNTMEDFHGVVLSLEKIYLDGRQLIKAGSGSRSGKPAVKQLQLQIGIKPTLEDCLEGLRLLHEMYQSEYHLKSSIVSALSVLTLKPSASDLGALQQLLVDQPNIPLEEVQLIFDIIFAEEIC